MTQKFGRSFRITIDPKDGGDLIVVTMPFTIEFWLQRNTLADLNRLSIDIYNLSEKNRNRIFQDRFDFRLDGGGPDTPPGRTVSFEAGYSTLYRIFEGTIFEANSSREGTNIITRIECRSGIYDVAATQTFQTMNSGQTVADIIKFLIGQFPTLQPGAIGDFPEVAARPAVLNGNTWELLKQYTSNNVFIDNGKVYALKDAEVVGDQVYLINDATGLLETPRRDEGFLTITTLLETGVNMSQLIKLQSSVLPVYNGQYKVIGIQHQGVISAAVAGDCRSTFNILAPGKFKQFTQVTEQ